MKRRCLARVLVVLLALSLGLPLAAPAATVGQFLTVEGGVEILKRGKFPATPAKVGDEVEEGDIILTKSASRAQVKFMDDTVLTIAPGSRVVIEDYLYDAAKGQRHAVVRIFEALVHNMVTRILRLEKPDFTFKTHTAVMGVRVSKVYLAAGSPQPGQEHPWHPEAQLFSSAKAQPPPGGFPPGHPVLGKPESLP